MKKLQAALGEAGLLVSSIEASPYAGGGVHVKIDGQFCITNIGWWPNGLMDVEYILLPSEKEVFSHRELRSSDEALSVFVQEVRLGLVRANSANGG